jgi:hypothetical protein
MGETSTMIFENGWAWKAFGELQQDPSFLYIKDVDVQMLTSGMV